MRLPSFDLIAARRPIPFVLDEDRVRGQVGINALLVGVALYIALGLNRSFWGQVRHGLPAGLHVESVQITVSLFVALVVLLLLVLLPLSARRIVRPTLAIVIMLAAAGSYFMDTFGVVIDSAMLTNLLQTDT